MSLLLIFLVVLTENIFKVSLKQPYPGIISFYLIGYYLKKKVCILNIFFIIKFKNII